MAPEVAERSQLERAKKTFVEICPKNLKHQRSAQSLAFLVLCWDKNIYEVLQRHINYRTVTERFYAL